MALAPEEVAHFIKKPPFFRVILQPQRIVNGTAVVEQACGKVSEANHMSAERRWFPFTYLLEAGSFSLLPFDTLDFIIL